MNSEQSVMPPTATHIRAESNGVFGTDRAEASTPTEIRSTFLKQGLRMLKRVYPSRPLGESDLEFGNQIADNFFRAVTANSSRKGAQLVFLYALPSTVESGVGYCVDICVGGKTIQEAQEYLVKEYIPGRGSGNDIDYGVVCFVGIHDYDTGRTSFAKHDPAFNVCRINWLTHRARILEDSIL